MSPYSQAHSDPLCRFQDHSNNDPGDVMDGSYFFELGTDGQLKAPKFGTHVLESTQGSENENNLGYLSTPRYLPSLADDKRGQLWTKTYGDGELNNQNFEEFPRTIPAVAECLEEFQRVAWVLPCAAIIDNPDEGCQHPSSEDPRNAQVDHGPIGVATFAASPSRLTTYTPQLRRQYEFICALCGSSYDRLTRARDCRYRDLGLSPYECEGRCGDNSCLATYSSEERWRRHLSGRVQCQRCDKEITRQNIARHRAVYCPNRER